MSLRACITAGSTAFAAGFLLSAGAVWACRPEAASDIVVRTSSTMLRTMITSRVAIASLTLYGRRIAGSGQPWCFERVRLKIDASDASAAASITTLRTSRTTRLGRHRNSINGSFGHRGVLSSLSPHLFLHEPRFQALLRRCQHVGCAQPSEDVEQGGD